MAYILKRKWKNKTAFRVQVTRKGFKSAFKSFPTRTEAKKWGRTMENKLDWDNFIDFTEAQRVTLGDILQRYIREDKHKKIKSWRMQEFRIAILLKDIISPHFH